MSYTEAMSLLDDLIEDVNVPDNTYNMIALALKKANDSEKHKNENSAAFVLTIFSIRKACHESIGLELASPTNGIILVASVRPGSISARVGMKPGDCITEVNNVRQYTLRGFCNTLQYIDGVVTIKTCRIEYKSDQQTYNSSRSEQAFMFQTRTSPEYPTRYTPLSRVRHVYNRIFSW